MLWPWNTKCTYAKIYCIFSSLCFVCLRTGSENWHKFFDFIQKVCYIIFYLSCWFCNPKDENFYDAECTQEFAQVPICPNETTDLPMGLSRQDCPTMDDLYSSTTFSIPIMDTLSIWQQGFAVLGILNLEWMALLEVEQAVYQIV